MQGHDKTIINFIDIFLAFQVKLELRERKVILDRSGMFPTFNEFLEDTKDVQLDGNIKLKIINNLQYLCCGFAKCFPDTAGDGLAFIRNLYLVADTDLVGIFKWRYYTQEEFIALEMTQLQKIPSKRRLFLHIGQPWYLCILELQAQPFDF